jgi:putative flippase GtrA
VLSISLQAASVRPLDRSTVRYVLVGAVNTVLGLLAIYACKWLFRLDDLHANLIGYTAGLAISFTLNKRWTFRFAGPALPALARFVLVIALAYLANLAAVLGLIAAGMNGYLAQAVGIVPYTIVGYLGSRLFAFPTRPDVRRVSH